VGRVCGGSTSKLASGSKETAGMVELDGKGSNALS
jgi:hypothetical protein